MIYRGSLNDSGNTWENNVILGNASSSTVGSDTLGYDGSGVDVFAGVATSDNSTFMSNIPLNGSVGSQTLGGGVSAEDGSTLSVSGGTFDGNQAGAGGGISAEDGSTLSVSGSTFDGNQAGDGGGISAQDGSTLSVSGTTFDGNQASDGGGAIQAGDNTNVTVVNSSFTDNNSSFGGGAVAVIQLAVPSTPSQLIVQSSNFAGNQAGYAGGAIQTLGATAKISDSQFTANQATGTFLQSFPRAVRSARGQFFTLSAERIPADSDGVHVHRQPGVALGRYRVRRRPGRGYLESDCDDRHGQRLRRQFRRRRAGPRRGHRRRRGFRGHHRPDIVRGKPGRWPIEQSVGRGDLHRPVLSGVDDDQHHLLLVHGQHGDGPGPGWRRHCRRHAWHPCPHQFTDHHGYDLLGEPGRRVSDKVCRHCEGGAIFSPSRPLSITSSSFLDNQAIGTSPPEADGVPAGETFGGAIESSGPSLTIDRSNFQRNIAQGGSSDFGGGNGAGGALSRVRKGRRLQLDIRRQSGRKWLRRRRLLSARSGGRRDRRPLRLAQPVECQGRRQ